MKPELPRACIIGAGCAGFTTAKRLTEYGIDYDCFEASDDIGGTWYYRNPNGASACYKSLHIDTSKTRLQFEDHPIPADFPDFPHHSQMLEYFRSYVDRFQLRPRITFNTRVEKAFLDERGLWQVSLSTGEQRSYDVLFVCNGHHWDPRWPDPYPGSFSGQAIHSHAYNDPFDPIDMRSKRVLIVGAGNSAMDISSELAQRPIASELYLSMRRGIWVIPKYLAGKPADKKVMPPWVPPALARAIAQYLVVRAVGRMEDYGLPKPDHGPLMAHPTVSGEFLTRVGSGDIKIKPGIRAFEGSRVRFTDDSSAEIDVIIYATGYKTSFPFFKQPEFLPAPDNSFPLWKRMMQPRVKNLFFMGLAQPLPTLVNLPEQQSKLCVAYLTGQYELPGEDEMQVQIVADEKRYLGAFYDSPRHRMQIDFAHYVAELKKELRRGKARAARTGFKPPVAALAQRLACQSAS
jgi:cation diffusion facilitator CzcD-associated flavoprotein CzcO